MDITPLADENVAVKTFYSIHQKFNSNSSIFDAPIIPMNTPGRLVFKEKFTQNFQNQSMQPLFTLNGSVFEPYCSAFDCSEEYSSEVDSSELSIFEEAKLDYSSFQPCFTIDYF